MTRHFTLLLLVLAFGVAVLFIFSLQQTGHSGVLRVAFLDVGQGDAIFIESPSGVQMLIDGGLDPSVLRRLGPHMRVSDRELDVVLATHPDADHIGGLVFVLRRYDVAHIFYSGIVVDTPAYTSFEAERTESVATSHISLRDTIIDLGGGAYVKILFPDRVLSQDTETNQASAVVEVVYGDVEFLLTGDAPQSIERYVVTLEGEQIQSEVLKVGHHGSKTSSSQYFIDAVRPAHAVISAGKDNRYGHPHKEVVARLVTAGAELLSTADQGDIIFETDGKVLWRK